MKPTYLMILACFALGPRALGMMVALPAVDSGFFNEAGRSSKNDGVLLGAPPATFNYSTGTIAEVPPLAGTDVNRRNFFTFDLSGFAPGTIVSASLSLYLPTDGYDSPDTTELYELAGIPAGGLGDMALFASDLTGIYDIGLAPTLAFATDIYTGLGSGPGGFGSIVVSDSDEDSMLTIPITPAGVGYLNTFAGGPTVLAGEVATLDLADGIDEVVFGFTAPLITGVVSPDPVISEAMITPTPVLMLEVIPEPTVGSLVLLGLVLMLRRKIR
ncbi:MAG: hypothetical protein HKN80_10840 [Acidimicrobiia bacterium]|nr:hypothetical protein [Acidimicrobiia bacterium]